MKRRTFLTAGPTGLALPAAGTAAPEETQAARTVYLSGDGIPLSPAEYSKLLCRLAGERGITPDNYSQGGVVEDLEARFAQLLGKEKAVFLPTGTLANHLAVRLLAGDKRRVLVQHESHLHNDSGDCAQTLSGLNLVPLARGRAAFTAAEFEEQIGSGDARVPVPVGAILIESPVRRRNGELFNYDEMKRITGLARSKGIGSHFDGARVFMASAYTGISPKEYASPFDTAYVSLYKYFNAGAGAILAGPRKLLDNLAHARRQFGGGLWRAWQFAAVALHYLEGFDQRYGRAVSAAERLFTDLAATGRFRRERIPNGSNLHWLHAETADLGAFRKRLEARGIRVAAPREGRLLVAVNETMNRRGAGELASDFVKALA